MPTLYTFGYTNWTLVALTTALTDLDAVLCDIRYAPRSRIPSWNRAKLVRQLGARYCHVPGLGNRNYRGGPIALVDLAQGLAQLEELLTHSPVLALMCACRDPQRCHRRVVAAACQAQLGLNATELQPPPPPPPPGTLFPDAPVETVSFKAPPISLEIQAFQSPRPPRGGG